MLYGNSILTEDFEFGSSFLRKAILHNYTDLTYSDAGEEVYNEYDPGKAERLLKEAEYIGEEIRFITTREYSYMYNGAAVMMEELKDVGMNVDLQVYDWSTVVSKREDPGEWELFITGFPPTTTPLEQLFLNPTWVDGPEDEKTEKLLQEIRNADSQEEGVKKWEELQEHLWNILPILKIGDIPTISASINEVEGLVFQDGPVLWNTSVER